MLKEARISYGITQKEASAYLGVPLRTYIRYENSSNFDNLKYQKMLDMLKDKYEITEDKGLLNFETIKRIVHEVLNEYEDKISLCYLFGSYSKGYAKETSDVDLCIDTELTGLKFVGLVEKLHQKLKKNVDVIRFTDIKGPHL